MDKKSKILTVIFFTTVVLSTVITFYRYIVLKDIVFVVDEEAFQESLLEEE